MSSYKLIYHDGRGKAEVSRMMFVLSDTKFEDVRVKEEEWPALKPKQPFAALPVLEVDGKTFCQSGAIERLLATRFGLYGKTDLERARADMLTGCLEDMFLAFIKCVFECPEEEQAEKKKKLIAEQLPPMLANLEKMIGDDEYSMGKQIMWPDLSFAHLLAWPECPAANMPIDLSKCPKLAALKKRVETHPKLADYIKNRPPAPF